MKSVALLAALAAMVAAAILGFQHRLAAIPPVIAQDHHFEVEKTDAEWKAELTPQEFNVLREKGTERAFTGQFWNHHDHGTYVCAACGQPLFSSETKFDSGTGWPSYWEPVSEEAVALEVDASLGMVRTEVMCGRCGGHLGHVFPDGPAPTHQRYCINSVSLDFEPAADDAAKAATAAPKAAE